MKSVRGRLTYANVMSSIAVFLVLAGGSAFAASQLGKNSVGTQQLKNDAVTTAKIKNGSVTGAKVNASSLGVVPNATHAASADTATAAGTATSADHAATAGTADRAATAGTADRAATAGTADRAATAGTADQATNATNAVDAQTAQSVAPGAPGVALAAVNVEKNGTVVGWFNRLGGEPTVSTNGPGNYEVAIPGIPIESGAKNVIAVATIRSSASNLTTSVFSGLQSRLLVKTAIGGGAAVSEGFELVVYGQTP
jgi:hypothetical protein